MDGQSGVFIGRTDIEDETPILRPPDADRWLIWKDPDAGKDWGQEAKGTTEDEIVGRHHRHNGHGFGWTPEVGDGQGGLVCCSSWGRKESDTTERLKWTENSKIPFCNFSIRNHFLNKPWLECQVFFIYMHMYYPLYIKKNPAANIPEM